MALTITTKSEFFVESASSNMFHKIGVRSKVFITLRSRSMAALIAALSGQGASRFTSGHRKSSRNLLSSLPALGELLMMLWRRFITLCTTKMLLQPLLGTLTSRLIFPLCTSSSLSTMADLRLQITEFLLLSSSTNFAVLLKSSVVREVNRL